MKPEEQRKAIATACGWKFYHYPKNKDGPAETVMVCKSYTLDDLLKRCPDVKDGIGPTPFTGFERLPNYLDSLDAIHEAESCLDYRQLLEYDRQLEQKCWYRDGEEKDGRISLIRATAAQRCEAFLRTLGLWTEEA